MFLENESSFRKLWLISGATTVLLPLLMFSIARMVGGEGDGGENNGEGEGECRWWQFGCSNGDENNDDGGEDGGDNDGQCRWWQFGCRGGDNGGGGDNDRRAAPWWWVFGGEDAGEDERTSPALVLIYLWSLVLFAVILHYGLKAYTMGKILVTVVMLAMFANMTFMSLFYLGGLEGAIDVEGRQVDQHGWYGQFGVLIYMTNLFWLLFSVTFIVLMLLPRSDRKTNTNQQEVYQLYADDTERVHHDEEKQQPERRKSNDSTRSDKQQDSWYSSFWSK